MNIKLDKVDRHLLAVRTWWVHKSSGYVVCKLNGKFTALHRMILGFPDLHVDHINRNKLDNRRKNLRVVYPSENNLNKGLQRNNTSGKKGASYHKHNNRWTAYIGKSPRIYMGSYTTRDEAAYVYDTWNKFLYGDLGLTNKEIRCKK